MTGRPTLRTPELLDEICGRLAEGRSLRSVCADDDMPAAGTVIRWLSLDEPFRERYARAKEASAEAIFEEMHHIADTPQVGERTKVTDGKTEVVTADMIEHRKLQVETRKWMLGKLKPKKYGDRLGLEHSGPDGGPIQIASAILESRRKRMEAEKDNPPTPLREDSHDGAE